jgi:hypothetical protein
MLCHKCKNEGVENSIFGQKFWYCRICKIEIELEERPPKVTSFYGKCDDEDCPCQSSVKSCAEMGRIGFLYYCEGGPKSKVCGCAVCLEAYS